MKKLFAILLAVLLPTLAFGQQLPLPSYRGVNVGGPVKVTHPTAETGTLLGPDGLDVAVFGSYRALSYAASTPGAHASNAVAGFASAIKAQGSTVFGPATADMAGFFSAMKQSYLTSTVEGEVLGIYPVVYQGRKGDAAAVLGAATKVKSGTGADTGGALGMELRAAWVNTSGTVQNAVHTLAPYMAPASDPSGGSGYGAWMESFNGINHAGLYVGGNLASDPATGWQYVLRAANDRGGFTTDYFAVVGNKVGGLSQPGDITQGYSGARKTIRNAGGTLQVRNNADTTTLLEVQDTGAVDIPGDPGWAAYTPTLACAAGSLTSGSAAGRYRAFGKTVHFRAVVTITTIGTCASSLNVGLPVGVFASSIFTGRSSVTPRMLMGSTGGSGSTTIFVTDYNNGFPFASADTVIINGTYERQ